MKRRLAWQALLGAALLGGPAASFGQQQVSAPTISGVLTAGIAGDLAICSTIGSTGDAAVIPGSVYLLGVDSLGKPQLPVLAVLRDDGVAPDVSAGDSIHCARINLLQAAPGLRRVLVSAAFYGQVRRVLSDAVPIEAVPAGTPTRPQPSLLDGNRCVSPADGLEFPCDELLLFFPAGTPFSIVTAAAQTVNGSIVGLVPFPTSNIWQVSLPCSTADCVLDKVAQLNQTTTHERRAEPNYLVTPAGLTPDDPLFPNNPALDMPGRQWGPQKINAPAAWALTRGRLATDRTSVPIIAIVDSGINAHPEFGGRITRGTDWSAAAAFADDCDHGTKVAGVAAATGNNAADIAGITWHARIFDTKMTKMTPNPVTGVLECKGSVAWMAAALRESVDAGGATVINYSNGVPARTKTEAVAVDHVNKSGRLLVSAAGNENTSVRSYPAGFLDRECFAGMEDCYDTRNVAVGGTTRADLKTARSNYGAWVRLYAPGTDILTTANTGAGTTSVGGTSFAAPHVAGVASLAKSERPTALMTEVMKALFEASDDTGNNDPDGIRMRRLNAFGAVFQAGAARFLTFGTPESPGLGVTGTEVRVGKAGEPRGGRQAAAVYGVSLPMERSASYDVTFSINFSTWDACSVAGGFRDCYSISVSPRTYTATLAQRPADLRTAPQFSVGLFTGGAAKGPAALQVGADLRTVNILGRAGDNFLNVILDTVASKDALFPSWGTIIIHDITPK